MKICTKCKVEKPKSEFNKDKTCKDGVCYICRVCSNEKNKIYYLDNREILLEKVKARIKANPEQFKEGRRAYKMANKEIIAEKAKARRKANPEQFKARNKAYNLANRDSISEKRKEHRKANPELYKARSIEYRKNNREYLLEKCITYRSLNSDKISAAGKARYYLDIEKTRLSKNTWAKNNPVNGAKCTARRRAQKLLATPTWKDELNDFLIEEMYHLSELRTKATGVRHHVDHIVPLKSELVCGLHIAINLRVIPGVDNLKKGNRTWPDMP